MVPDSLLLSRRRTVGCAPRRRCLHVGCCALWQLRLRVPFSGSPRFNVEVIATPTRIALFQGADVYNLPYRAHDCCGGTCRLSSGGSGHGGIMPMSECFAG